MCLTADLEGADLTAALEEAETGEVAAAVLAPALGVDFVDAQHWLPISADGWRREGKDVKKPSSTDNRESRCGLTEHLTVLPTVLPKTATARRQSTNKLKCLPARVKQIGKLKVAAKC